MKRDRKINIPQLVNRMSTGATYVEASVTLIIFISSIFFFIDISRYFYILGVLNYAAHSGLDLASKLDMEEKTSSSDCSAANHERCDNYLRRWRAIERKVLSIADLVTSPSTRESKARRLSFRHYYSTGQTHTYLPETISDVVILRPGEQAQRVADGVTYQVPGRPFCAGDGCALNSGWPQAGESWIRVFREHPIAIRMDVQFKPVAPFVPAVMIHVEQYGRRLSRSVGAALPPLPPPLPTATRTQTPIITPSATPTFDPYETPTTPTAVPTRPPPTATPDCGCCNPPRPTPKCDLPLCRTFPCFNPG